MKKRRKHAGGFVILVALLLCMAAVFAVYGNYSGAPAQTDTPLQTDTPPQSHTSPPSAQQPQTPLQIASPEEITHLPMPDISLHSTNALLMDFNTGEILHYQNGTDTMHPASLVKMMTALVALENIPDLNETVFLDEAIFAPIHLANATTAGFLPNDRVRALDLLYGLLLPSGAECGVGLAIHVAGSERAFVAMMNERAKELGMSNTNFTNVTGLHDSGQVSTAVDMAVLLRYALENETFRQIITAARHSTAGTALRSDGITFHSTLFSRMDSPDFDGGSILGGRTGFTDQSGQNLASFARVNGVKYILVTSGAQTGGNHLSQALHIEDAFTVFGAIG